MDLCLPITKSYAGNLGNRATALENQSPVSQTVQAPKWYLLANNFLKEQLNLNQQNINKMWHILE